MKKISVGGAFLTPLVLIFLPTLLQLIIFTLVSFGIGYYTCWLSQAQDSEKKEPVVESASADSEIFSVEFPSNDSRNRVRYRGTLVNDLPNGSGTMVWKSGGSYSGEWKDGKRHGQGVAKWPLKCKSDWYEGDWQEDKRWGFGTYTNKDGSSYAGQWLNDLRHGFGVFTYAKESPAEQFEGYWKEGKHSGLGLYSWKDGSKYVGQMEGGLFHGYGVYRYEPESIHDRYEGSWIADKQDGTGTLYWKNGDKYIGHFKDDKMHGLGIKMAANGHVMQHGEWSEELFQG